MFQRLYFKETIVSQNHSSFSGHTHSVFIHDKKSHTSSFTWAMHLTPISYISLSPLLCLWSLTLVTHVPTCMKID